MQSKKSCSVTRRVFAILLTFLLVSAVVVQPAQAQTFKVLHTFRGPDGANPVGQLVRDKAGDLFGATSNGGAGKCRGGCGAAFKINKAGKEVWLHSFNFGNGFEPDAGLVRDAAGNLYGTTLYGGYTTCVSFGCGTVFKLDKTGKERLLYKFNEYPDAYFPEALLVQDVRGNLYGTTYSGGTSDLGTVFRVDSAGKETILHNFAGPPDGGGDGAFSYTGVIRDSTGNLYGVTGAGGAYGDGVVYRLDSSGNETLLYSFTGGGDGGGPNSVLLADSAGNLYGTTEGGGNLSCPGGSGCGVVFELSPQSEGSWTETTLYTFCSLSNCADGQFPHKGPLIRDAAGNLYGSTVFGGTYRNCNGNTCGVVFKLDPSGNETVLHSFTAGADGAYPWLDVIDASGNLYGATGQGGDLNCAPNRGYGCGTLFKITP
jgi:uncharacterized repeat protein (TIGR03803 family)